MIKKIANIFFILIFLFFIVKPVFAQEKKVNIYFFWGNGCPHCNKEKAFLEKLKIKYPYIEIHDFEAWENKENRELFIETGKKLNADTSGVPFTVVGKHYFIGWYDEKTTGSSIEEAIKCVYENGCDDVVKGKIGPKNLNPEISVPFLGKIKTKNFSLPILTIILGALDGFNPCAMWTLLFLISLLLGMKDKKRMWILGTVFIITSSFVYFLFMAAWLNILLFLGFINWIKIIIGLIALAGGGYNLKEFFTNKQSGCKVANNEKRRAVFEKLKKIIHRKQFLFALGGIIILAFAVNLVELICSAGLPVIFTQILTLSHLAKWQYYAYMLLYIFIFMADDLFIFFTAMITLQMTGISTKYSRASHLIGGVLMAIIGVLLLLKPELLMFG